MKILYVITGLGGGGAEKIVCDLADQMALKDHDVKIAYLTGDVVVRPKLKDVDLIYLALEKSSDFYKAYKNYKVLLDKFSPDIVHAHMVHANIFTRISRKFYSINKLICSAHSNNEGGQLRMLAYKYTHQFADITTNVSHNASENFEKLGAVPKGGIITVYNGVDIKKFDQALTGGNLRSELDIDPTTPLFIAVGRFHEVKDYPNLIKAFSLIIHQKPTDQRPMLIIVGDGEERAKIEADITHYNLNDDVKLLGRREDISDLLNISDYFVLSSKYEGLPTVVIEAMACKTFVIATDCGGSAEIMGGTGILVPPENSQALAKALNDANHKTILEIKENNLKARQRVEDLFSLEKSVQAWLNLYEQN